MWFITLLVLAVAAVLIIKAVKAHSIRQASETEDLPLTSGIQGSLQRASSPATGGSGQPSSARPVHKDSTSTPSLPETSAPIDRQSTLDDIREKIKILNLAASDAPHLGISSEEFNAIRNPDDTVASVPSSDILADVAERLRRMTN